MNAAPKRIALADLQAAIRMFEPQVRADPNWTTFTLAKSVIGHFLGKDWVKSNIIQDERHSQPDGFFRLDFSSPERREIKTARMFYFAETLFNLQHVDGFDHRVEQMRTGNPEAGAAEFDFGRFLHIHDVDFRYVVPSGQRGRDFDCAVTYGDGRIACADAKCRLEGSDIRPQAIRSALEKARSKNLPKDKPGIIFIKVPQACLESLEVRQGLVDVAADFLRQTERVVLIALYVSVSFLHEQHRLVVHRHLVEEVENSKHRFDRSKIWRLFKSFQVPRGWNGMPPKWHRIFSRGSDDPAYPHGQAA
jgi:hypothetical protein